jgi:dethiobiotin synthetase
MKRYVISATGTDVGKTLASAILMSGLDADYWKPIQCGPDKDTKTVRAWTGLPENRFHPEAYDLTHPLSPHRAAEMDDRLIDLNTLEFPPAIRTLLIEGAGGLMVPVTRDRLMIDLFATWQCPVILCARTELGTINHTLLSIEVLKTRRIPLHGLIFLGAENTDTIRTIAGFSHAKILGHIPLLNDFSPSALKEVFAAHFHTGDF